MTSEEISKLLKEKNDSEIMSLYSAMELRMMTIELAGFNPIKSTTKQRLLEIMRKSERAVERSKIIRILRNMKT